MACRIAVVLACCSVHSCVGRVGLSDAETTLAGELAGNIDAARLAEIEAELRPTFNAMPKDDGKLGHQAVRYVLHRLFVERHSWYVTGLEPGDEDKPLYLEGENIPAHLQNMLEARLGSGGIHLHELAALAAAIEDLVHKEAHGNLEQVYQMHKLSVVGNVASEQVHDVISTYMMFYLEGGKFTPVENVKEKKERFMLGYADWNVVEDWFRAIVEEHLTPAGLEFTGMKRLIATLSEKFGFFNDRECRDLKRTMLEIKDGSTGRVRLSDFYAKALHSHWQFNEKADYLRTIGALDEMSDPKGKVILPNYIMSRSNCLESSSLYAVCCRNECEDLMSKLEHEIAQPTAKPARIVDLVQSLTSNTVTEPRKLSRDMLGRLDKIAVQNAGVVPLHGRLFAQWMHHAFPLECPFPHEAGTATPQTPDEWMKEVGHADGHHRVSHEDMRSHVDEAVATQAATERNAEEEAALHWSDAEEHVFAAHPGMWSKRRAAARQTSTGSYRSLVLVPSFLVLLACAAYLAAPRYIIEIIIGFAKQKEDFLPGSIGSSRSEKQVRRLVTYAGCAALVVMVIVLADALGLFDRRAFAIAIGFAVVGGASKLLFAHMENAQNLKAKSFGLWEGEHDKWA